MLVTGTMLSPLIGRGAGFELLSRAKNTRLYQNSTETIQNQNDILRNRQTRRSVVLEEHLGRNIPSSTRPLPLPVTQPPQMNLPSSVLS